MHRAGNAAGALSTMIDWKRIIGHALAGVFFGHSWAGCPQLVGADIRHKKADSRFDPEPT
jgi:hypothetical protein